VEQFRTYDDDGSGELGMKEINRILEDFGLLPRSKEEQEQMANCIEHMDADGSGYFDVEEFQDFYQVLVERIEQGERQRILKCARGVGLSHDLVYKLQRHFLQLHVDDYGTVSEVDIAHSIYHLRMSPQFSRIPEAKIRDTLRDAQKHGDRRLTFDRFVALAKRLLDAFYEDDDATNKKSEKTGKDGDSSNKLKSSSAFSSNAVSVGESA